MASRINRGRLLGRLETFSRIGGAPRRRQLPARAEQRGPRGRDLLVQWMRELSLAVTIDAIGNIVGVRSGRDDLAPVMLGSHVDTVGTSGANLD
jgi:beta-ureidopropionase / N-carbamoyl-L-amino-acid hydrolase